MITRRIASAFVVALIISGIFTYWLSQRFTKAHAPAAVKNRYAAAAQNLEAGQPIRAENVSLIDWPASMPLPGAFPTPEPVLGRTVLYPLAAGEPILERQLSSPGAGAGLTVKIPEGMRAISLRSDEVVGVAGFLLPGTHVDVLVTLRAANSAEPVTSTVLQDVEILATGQKTQPDPEGKAATATVVTLLVRPEDAKRVVLASAQGTIHFVLRNGSDRQKLDGKPVQLSQLQGSTMPTPVIQRNVRIANLTAKPYTVETILGSKQRMDSFQ